MKAVLLADFINNPLSIASVRQGYLFQALEATCDEVSVLTREQCANDSSRQSKQRGFIAWLKSIDILEKLRVKWGVMKSLRIPDGNEFYYIKLSLTYRGNPDVIVASFGPASILIAAYVLVWRFPKAKLWIDYRDLYCNNPNYLGIPILRLMERWFNYYLNKKAYLITTVSLGLATDIPPANKICVVYNKPRPHDPGNADKREVSLIESKKSENCFGYFGTYYDNYQINNLIEFFNDKADVVKQLFLAGDCKVLENKLLAAKIPRLDIRYLGFISQSDIYAYRNLGVCEIYFATGHIGKGILSGKLFDYLSNKIPVLVTGTLVDEEAAKVLSSIPDVIYTNGMYCSLTDSAEKINCKVHSSFGDVIDEYFF